MEKLPLDKRITFFALVPFPPLTQHIQHAPSPKSESHERYSDRQINLQSFEREILVIVRKLQDISAHNSLQIPELHRQRAIRILP
jgi:hypothetical protein